MSDRDTRTEAAANALYDASRDPDYTGSDVLTVLAAADADDRENGLVRIKLDDELAERIAITISGRETIDGLYSADMLRAIARDVLAVLREAVQP